MHIDTSSRPMRHPSHVSLGTHWRFVGKVPVPKREAPFRVDTVFCVEGGSSAGIPPSRSEPVQFAHISDSFTRAFVGRVYDASPAEPACEVVIDCHTVLRSLSPHNLYRTLRHDERRITTLAEVAAVLAFLDAQTTEPASSEHPVRVACKKQVLHWFCQDAHNNARLVRCERSREASKWIVELLTFDATELAIGSLVFTHGRPI